MRFSIIMPVLNEEAIIEVLSLLASFSNVLSGLRTARRRWW